MSETPPQLPLQVGSRPDHVFPTLTPAQITRASAHGAVRPLRRGEVLFDAGNMGVPFFIVTKGQIELVRPTDISATPVTVLGPGQFTGEANMLTGRRS